MASVLRQAWALLLGMLLLMTANSLQGTLLGVRGAIETIDTTTMGYIMSGYFAGFLAGSRAVPPLLRHVGHIRVYAALGTLLSVAFLLFAVRVDPLFWLLLRGVVGFCYSGLYIVTESWLNELSDNRTRGQAMSLNMLVQMLAVVVGQWLVSTADPGGYALFIMISVIVSLSFLPILLTISPTPAHESSRPMSIRELVALSPLACLGMLLLGTVVRDDVRHGRRVRDGRRVRRERHRLARHGDQPRGHRDPVPDRLALGPVRPAPAGARADGHRFARGRIRGVRGRGISHAVHRDLPHRRHRHASLLVADRLRQRPDRDRPDGPPPPPGCC